MYNFVKNKNNSYCVFLNNKQLNINFKYVISPFGIQWYNNKKYLNIKIDDKFNFEKYDNLEKNIIDSFLQQFPNYKNHNFISNIKKYDNLSTNINFLGWNKSFYLKLPIKQYGDPIIKNNISYDNLSSKKLDIWINIKYIWVVNNSIGLTIELFKINLI